jgi:hypothetical protein
LLGKTVGKIYRKGRKYMLNKQELIKITIVSSAMILMLVNIVAAMPCNCGATLITDNCTQSVNLLKFPACGSDCGCDCGYGAKGRGATEYGVTLITDPSSQSVDLLKFPACGCGATGRGAYNR